MVRRCISVSDTVEKGVKAYNRDMTSLVKTMESIVGEIVAQRRHRQLL